MYQVGLNYIGYTSKEVALIKMLEKFGFGNDQIFVEDFKLFSEEVKDSDLQGTYFEVTTVVVIKERETMESFLLDLDTSLTDLSRNDQLKLKSKTIEYTFLGKDGQEEEFE